MEITTVGIDLAKNVFQVHAVSRSGEVIVRRALRRAQVIPFFAKDRPVSSGWKPAARAITGRASSLLSGTRCE